MIRSFLLLLIFVSLVVNSFIEVEIYTLQDKYLEFYIDIKGDATKNDIYKVNNHMLVKDLLDELDLNEMVDLSKINLGAKLYPEMVLRLDKEKDVKLISINNADIHELAMLPGIKEGYAKRIIDYRNENGPFLKLDDLKNVKGIGDKKYEKIYPFICL